MYIIKIITAFIGSALLVHSLLTRGYNDGVKHQRSQYICYTSNSNGYYHNYKNGQKYIYSSGDLQCINANGEFYINK